MEDFRQFLNDGASRLYEDLYGRLNIASEDFNFDALPIRFGIGEAFGPPSSRVGRKGDLPAHPCFSCYPLLSVNETARFLSERLIISPLHVAFYCPYYYSVKIKTLMIFRILNKHQNWFYPSAL